MELSNLWAAICNSATLLAESSNNHSSLMILSTIELSRIEHATLPVIAGCKSLLNSTHFSIQKRFSSCVSWRVPIKRPRYDHTGRDQLESIRLPLRSILPASFHQ